MNASLIGTYRAGSSEWHEARRAGLGGSEIAAVVGLSPWESAWHLWQVKAGNLEPSNLDSVRLRIGSHLEDAVVAEGRHRGHFMRRTGMWRHEGRQWQLAEPDRLLTKTARGRRPVGVFEAKTVDPSMAWEWGPDGGGADDIPPHYRAQVAWYLSCLDLPEAVATSITVVHQSDLQISLEAQLSHHSSAAPFLHHQHFSAKLSNNAQQGQNWNKNFITYQYIFYLVKVKQIQPKSVGNNLKIT